MNGEAANQDFQRVAHSSTLRYAGGLNVRVRDGYGCFPAALAAFMPTDGIEPSTIRYRLPVNRIYVRSS
jgi:hypothetical protein